MTSIWIKVAEGGWQYGTIIVSGYFFNDYIPNDMVKY